MPAIEWQDTEELEPSGHPLEDFCSQHNLPWERIKDIQGTVAFIEKEALESLNEFLANDTRREHGGVLVGRPYIDMQDGRVFSVINRAIPALETEGSAVHLQFTSEIVEIHLGNYCTGITRFGHCWLVSLASRVGGIHVQYRSGDPERFL